MLQDIWNMLQSIWKALTTIGGFVFELVTTIDERFNMTAEAIAYVPSYLEWLPTSCGAFISMILCFVVINKFFGG